MTELTEDVDSFEELINYIKKYKHLISRTESFNLVINLIKERFRNNPINIVETGCQRDSGHGGDGYSTSVFARLAKITGGHLWTVDINEENINKCKDYTKQFSDYITYVVGDSIQFLESFDKPIHLLYLDSCDTGCGSQLEGACVHQLNECKESLKNLIDSSIFLSDDAGYLDSGKVKYSYPFMLENGFKLIFQSLEIGQLCMSKINNNGT